MAHNFLLLNAEEGPSFRSKSCKKQPIKNKKHMMMMIKFKNQSLPTLHEKKFLMMLILALS